MMPVKSLVWKSSKKLARYVWFRDGKCRKALAGPYAGLLFAVCPQMKSRMVVYFDAYEPDVCEFLCSTVTPGMTVFVVGAHVGIHVLHIAKLLAGNGTVYAFEAWPDNYQILSKNIKCNSQLSTSIFAVNKAVGKGNGLVRFTRGNSDGTHHLTRPDEDGTLRIEMVSLDTFASEAQCVPDFLLADVEESEMEVLLGAQGIIRYRKPLIVLEHHGRQREVVELLEQHNYHITILGRHIYANSSQLSPILGLRHPMGR